MSGINVEEGDTILIPLYSDQAKQVEVKWSQDHKDKSAKYYCLLAENKSKQFREVLIYVQDTYYRDETNNSYIGKIPGIRKDDSKSTYLIGYKTLLLLLAGLLYLSLTVVIQITLGYWEVIVNNRFQYGQKNRQGEGRWLVYHDQGRDMWQVSIIEPINANATH